MQEGECRTMMEKWLYNLKNMNRDDKVAFAEQVLRRGSGRQVSVVTCGGKREKEKKERAGARSFACIMYFNREVDMWLLAQEQKTARVYLCNQFFVSVGSSPVSS